MPKYEVVDAPPPRATGPGKPNPLIEVLSSLAAAGPAAKWTVVPDSSYAQVRSVQVGGGCRALLAAGIDPDDFDIEVRSVEGDRNKRTVYLRFNPGRGEGS